MSILTYVRPPHQAKGHEESMVNSRNGLLLVLVVGLVLRVGLLVFFWDQPLTIVDETHYQMIAENILKHHEFSRIVGQPTAIRPPLYPIFLSSIYFITGGVNFNTIRIAQIVLSLGVIFILYLLGKILFDEKSGILASLIFATYPSFLFFTHLLLSEILFTFLMLLFVYYFLSFLYSQARACEDTVRGSEFNSKDKRLLLASVLLSFKKKNRAILLAGLFLGLGALTRSILYPFLFITIFFIIIAYRGTLIEKSKWVLLLTLGFLLVVGPWTIRNFILFKNWVVIDTMGGLNLYMGNYEHTPLNRAWSAIDLTGDKRWYHGHEKVLSEMNEAEKQEWAINKAKEFIYKHKWLTLKRNLIKAANLWGLEREIIGAIINGNWPQLNKTAYLLIITFVIFSSYGFVLVCSLIGIMYNLSFKRKDVLLCFVLICFFTGMHAIVFGHSRYHLPLIPLLAIFASWSLMNIKKIWKCSSLWMRIGSIIFIIILVCIWVREILFIEGDRFLKNIRM